MDDDLDEYMGRDVAAAKAARKIGSLDDDLDAYMTAAPEAEAEAEAEAAEAKT